MKKFNKLFITFAFINSLNASSNSPPNSTVVNNQQNLGTKKNSTDNVNEKNI